MANPVTNTLGLPFVINGPVPVPGRYNLLTVADVIDEPDPHWQQGIRVWGWPSIDDGDTQDPCSSGTARIKIEGGSVPLPTFGAFAAYVAETCSALGIGNDEEFFARAATAFGGLEPTLVEREFARGLQKNDNPFLADSGAVMQAAGVQSPLDALALLETAIAETGHMGVLHATPDTAIAWVANHLAFPEGRFLRSVATGTPIVVGYGYLDAVPDVWGTQNVPSDAAFAFATGPVQVIRSELVKLPGELSQALDRQNNVVTYRAERYYVVDWDTELQAAVLVDRNA